MCRSVNEKENRDSGAPLLKAIRGLSPSFRNVCFLSTYLKSQKKEKVRQSSTILPACRQVKSFNPLQIFYERLVSKLRFRHRILYSISTLTLQVRKLHHRPSRGRHIQSSTIHHRCFRWKHLSAISKNNRMNDPGEAYLCQYECLTSLRCHYYIDRRSSNHYTSYLCRWGQNCSCND